jgi:hypothetical protein
MRGDSSPRGARDAETASLLADGDARARSWTRATVSSVAAIVASAAFVVLATRPSADSTSARLSLAPGDADADAVARSVVDPFCDARSGHLAPSVFLLGVEKCGTSSLFEDMTASLPALRKMHARVGDHWEQHKEMRYFDTDGRFVNYGAPDLHVGLGWSDWLRGHGDACDAVVGDVRRAAGAAPSSSGESPAFGGVPHKHIDGTPAYFTRGIAAKMARAYDEEMVSPGGASAKSAIRFVVLTCDPEERARKAFAFFKTLDGWAIDGHTYYTRRYATYADWLEDALRLYPDAAKPGGLIDRWAERRSGEAKDDAAGDETASEREAMNALAEIVKCSYDDVLREYERAGFDPSQFLVLPNAFYYEEPEAALRAIARHVGSEFRREGAGGPGAEGGSRMRAAHANANGGRKYGASDAKTLGNLTEGMTAALREILRPKMEGLRDMACPRGTVGPGGGAGAGLGFAAFEDARARERFWGNIVPRTSREGECREPEAPADARGAKTVRRAAGE